MAGLASVLPSLRTGEALVSGEAVVLPTRVALRRPAPEQRASDPTLDGWRDDPAQEPDVRATVAKWRGASIEEEVQ